MSPGEARPLPTSSPSPAPQLSGGEREAVTQPGGDDAAGRLGHSWPLPERSPTRLARVTAPAKLPDTETPQGVRVPGTILRLMGSDSSAPPPSAPVPPAAPPLLRLTGPLQAQPQCVPWPPRSSPTSRCPALRCVPGRERGGGGAELRGSGDRGTPGEAQGSCQ